jgi:hypothetical protein
MVPVGEQEDFLPGIGVRKCHAAGKGMGLVHDTPHGAEFGQLGVAQREEWGKAFGGESADTEVHGRLLLVV